MYRVLKPTYQPTGETTQTDGVLVKWHRATFVDLGLARDMTEALRKFPRSSLNGYSPVLEPVKSH